ncbi:MAG: hypothetical protein ABI972_26425, partial [Acidobacteriota bacterium]
MKKLIGMFVLAGLAVAEVRTIETGTTISIRTNESINAKKDDGRVFTGVVDQDVTDGRGNVAIPRGSNVELMVRKMEDRQLSLDLESVMVNGQRYAIAAGETELSATQKDSVGKNERTAKYMGGGAILGAVIGAIAGGGKGAAIGAAAGAGAGAGAQVLTRGK